jgi:Uma2 family endonuclease
MVTTQRLTAGDLWNIKNDSEDYELIEGVLSPMVPPGAEHAIVQIRLGSLVLQYTDVHQSGEVLGEGGFILATDPDSVLAPDLAYVEASRLPDDLTGFLALAPDLAVEIVSPGNSPGEIERKVAIYLLAGTPLVWVVYPRQRQIVVHTPGDAPRVLGESDELSGGDVLPGLVIPVARIFR